MMTKPSGRWLPVDESLAQWRSAALERWQGRWRPATAQAMQSWSQQALATGRERVEGLAVRMRRLADRLEAMAGSQASQDR
jgi:hypothetical protein